MGIRALCLAAAAAVGVGQAEAATVDYTRSVRMTLVEHTVCTDNGCSTPSSGYNGLTMNDTIRGVLSIKSNKLIQDPDEWYGTFGITLRDASGRLINGFGVDWQGPGQLDQRQWSFSSYDEFWLSWDGKTGHFREAYGDGRVSVIAQIALAPIPLPASAAFLPVGLATLTMIRKRRKSAQATAS